MKNIFAKIAATAASTVALSVAIAQTAPKAEAISLTIANPGFEDPVLEDGGFTDKSIPGWELYDPSNLISIPFVANYSVFNPASYSYPDEAPEGNNVGAVFLALDPGSGVAGISQILSSVLTAGTKYDLQVKVGNAAPDPFTGPGFPGYAVQLLAGGQVIAQDFNTQSPAEGAFVTSTVSYIASGDDPNLGKSLEIRLLNILESTGAEIGFDDVRLEATKVPEPTSILGLLGLGAIGATSALKKKQHSA